MLTHTRGMTHLKVVEQQLQYLPVIGAACCLGFHNTKVWEAGRKIGWAGI